MDDSELIDEVLQLTLACQRGDATSEERARLERLLADNPQAIGWYLRIVDDTLTLLDATAARETASHSVPGAADVSADESASQDKCTTASTLSARRLPRSWLTIMAITCGLLVALVAIQNVSFKSPGTIPVESAADSARVMEVSNVIWSDGAKQFGEWSLVKPGDRLKFESGWVNLFLANGAELLVEGPADVQFVSVQNVFARQGKLAARVGPGAVGLRIDTPHAQVTDRGTAFGISVDGDSHTSVVVYEGKVDLDVVGAGAGTPPRRRLQSGEAISVDRAGQLSRITTVERADFLEPPQISFGGVSENRLITSVSDNVRSLETAKYYRVIPHGFQEDCRAYVDRLHEWNGVDVRKLPAFLVGGDYVMTYNDDKITTEIQIALSIGQPANVYVLIDDRVPPPDWLMRDFIDTKWDVGCDEGWEDKIIDTGVGAGNSIDHVFSVWRRVVSEPTTVLFGPLSYQQSPPPKVDDKRSMYGIVVTPLRGQPAVN
jgi:FecR protein